MLQTAELASSMLFFLRSEKEGVVINRASAVASVSQ